MTHHSTVFLCALLALISPTVAEPGKPAESLEDQLVETYTAWRTSMIDGDFAAWNKHTANYRRAVTRNNIISQKLKFPDALFTVPMMPASIEGLEPIQARAVGPTGQLVFYGAIDVGFELPEGATLPDSLLILKFIKDGSEWKFNTLSLLNIQGAEDIRNQLAKKDYRFLDNGNFVPPGFVPFVPNPCPVPAYVAQIQITSFGYETEVIINGISKHKISDTAKSDLIIGGLKNSPNSVAITSRPIAAPESDGSEQDDIPRKLEVSVFALPNKKEAPAHKAWSYQPSKVLPSYSGIFFAMPR